MRKEFVKRLAAKEGYAAKEDRPAVPLEEEAPLPLDVDEEKEEGAPSAEGAPSPQLSPKEAKRRQTQVLRQRIRLRALEVLAENQVEAGLLLALAAGILSLKGLSRLEGALNRSLEAGLAQAALDLLSLPKEIQPRGSWPGGRGWPFLAPALDRAVEAQNARLTLELGKASLEAPLFLAALLPLAVETWGAEDPRTERVVTLVTGRLVPLLRRLTLERVLDPSPRY